MSNQPYFEHLLDNGMSINEHGALYSNGRKTSEMKRLQIIEVYYELLGSNSTLVPSVKQVAEKTCVTWKTADKVLRDHFYGELPSLRPLGPGSKKHLTVEHELFLLYLRKQNNKRTLLDYTKNLYYFYNIYVSPSTINRWFLQRFHKRGGCRVTGMVAVDKYRPKNILNYGEYVSFITNLPTQLRLIFIDEKSLKGSELYNRKGRACPLTGIVEDTIVSSDFRNTYCIMGMISVDKTKNKPMLFTIGKFFSLKTLININLSQTILNVINLGDDNHDSMSFRMFIEEAILTGWLRPYDMIVCDNAAIHGKGYNVDLEEFLWNSIGLDGLPLNILLLPLPTRSPELNPIELVWNILRTRLVSTYTSSSTIHVNHAVAICASNVLSDIKYSEIESVYKRCGYNKI